MIDAEGLLDLWVLLEELRTVGLVVKVIEPLCSVVCFNTGSALWDFEKLMLMKSSVTYGYLNWSLQQWIRVNAHNVYAIIEWCLSDSIGFLDTGFSMSSFTWFTIVLCYQLGYNNYLYFQITFRNFRGPRHTMVSEYYWTVWVYMWGSASILSQPIS